MKQVPEFYAPSKKDLEFFDYLMKNSESAIACNAAFQDGELFRHAAYLADLVKIGYSREELYAFFRVMYQQKENTNDQSNK